MADLNIIFIGYVVCGFFIISSFISIFNLKVKKNSIEGLSVEETRKLKFFETRFLAGFFGFIVCIYHTLKLFGFFS